MYFQPVKIILIEDNLGDIRIIQDLLKNAHNFQYELIVTHRMSTGLEYLNENDVDVILLDLGLPDSQNHNTFRSIFTKHPQIPIVVLTGLDDQESALKAVWGGAQDYLIKGQVTSSILERAIRYAIERNNSEKEIRESEDKYRTLFESAQDAIVISNPDHRFINVNPAAIKLFGYSSNEFSLLTTLDLFANPVDQILLQQTLKTRKMTKNYDVTFKHKNGSEIDCLVNISAQLDKEGRIITYNSIIRDITALKQTEQEMINQQNYVKFLHDLMSHDLNNINQSILWSLELILKHSELTDQYKELVQNTLEQLNRSSDLIANVNKVEQISSTSQLLKKTNFNTIFYEAVKMVQLAFPNKILKLTTNISQGKNWIRANELLIDILFNILHNAMKYDQKKQVILEIDISTADIDFLIIEFKDQGPGIPDTMKKNIFTRITSRQDDVKGLGIGLTLVNTIVDIYDGRIHVEDRIAGDPTQGSNFVLQLPRWGQSKKEI